MFQAFSRRDATNLESPRATATQIQNLEVAALALPGHADSWREQLMHSRDLEVATSAPFSNSESRRATVTPIRGLDCSHVRTSWRVWGKLNTSMYTHSLSSASAASLSVQKPPTGRSQARAPHRQREARAGSMAARALQEEQLAAAAESRAAQSMHVQA